MEVKKHHCDIKTECIKYKIGIFSKMNQVTIKTLRHYDEIGLLKPSYIDKFTGYRYYTSETLPVLHKILALRDMGFSLEEIRQVLGGISEQTLLQQKRIEIMRTIAKETLKLSQVESYLSSGCIKSDYHVIIKELPEVIVASMRVRLPSYDGLFDKMPAMGAEMERLGCVCAIPEYCFNIYYDGEYKIEDIDVEMCEAVTEKKQDSDLVKFKVMPKVETAACILHKGPYSEFPKAYQEVSRWVEENGYELTDFPRESYIDGIWNKDDENDWLTEIQFPVRRRAEEKI